MLTKKQLKALAILKLHPDVTAGAFALFYYTEPEYEYLFTACSNQGNGACRGKKAWLCAGSLLGRLIEKGWVKRYWKRDSAPLFKLTAEGEKALAESSTPGVCSICGCTEDNACSNPRHGNCWWTDETRTICSHCAVPEIANDPDTVHPETH